MRKTLTLNSHSNKPIVEAPPPEVEVVAVVAEPHEVEVVEVPEPPEMPWKERRWCA